MMIPLLTTARLASAALFLAATMPIHAEDQSVPPKTEEEPWTSLYKDKLDDFRIYFRGQGYIDDVHAQKVFLAEPGQIHVINGTAGLIVTKVPYSHYHVKVDYRWGEKGGSLNAGLMTHIDLESKVVKDNRPRSIEINMRHDSPGSIWMAKGLGPFGSSFVKEGSSNYLPQKDGGVSRLIDPFKDRTVYGNYPDGKLNTNPHGEWNTLEAIVRGAESMEIIHNGRVVLRVDDIREADTAAKKPGTPLDSGGIGLQSEGQELFYQNFLIRKLPDQAPDSTAIKNGIQGKTPGMFTNLKERLEYKGVILEDPDYNIWGSSSIWGNDGKVHVFAARIPVDPGFRLWWATSQIAHYVADQPEGPFSLVEVLLKPGDSPEGAWDHGPQHNPTITKIDGLYVLCYHSGKGTPTNRQRSSIRIGMMTATDINGPWKKLGMVLDPPTSKESNVVPPDNVGFTDNPSLVKAPDGRYFLYYRIKFRGLSGGNTYGVAIADKLEGPYIHQPERVVNNPTYIEDPYVFIHDGLFYMLITDNENHQGLLLTSKDGLHFDYHQGHPYGLISDYIPPEQMPSDPADVPRGCFERPQLLFKDGLPTHLYAPALTGAARNKKSRCYLFEIRNEPRGVE